MSVEYKPVGPTSGAIPASTKIRTTVSTQEGHTDAEIQHVKLDTGDGTNVQPVSLVAGSLEGTTVTVYNITLTDADTEYSQELPAGTRSIWLMCRTAAAVRYAFVTGKVATPTAPYLTLPANAGYSKEHIYLASSTLYLASSSAGVVVELEVWS